MQNAEFDPKYDILPGFQMINWELGLSYTTVRRHIMKKTFKLDIHTKGVGVDARELQQCTNHW